MKPHLQRDFLSAELGAVYVEYLAALVPCLLVAFSALQLVELWTGEVAMKRAASAAARAAAVVLPDEPRFYENVPAHRFEGARKTAVELAAALVLVPSPQFRELGGVELEFPAELALVTVTVRAKFTCSLGIVSVVCGGGERVLTARASFPYQGARYAYARSAS